MLTIAQGLPANISVEWLIYAIVIVIWAGSWLATQVTAQRKKAAQKAKEAPRPARGPRDAFAEELNRKTPREQAAQPDRASLLEMRSQTESSRRPVSPRPSPPSPQARTATPPANPPSPPDISQLFRDPKAFAQQMQQFAEHQQQSQQPSGRAANRAPGQTGQAVQQTGVANRSTAGPQRTPPKPAPRQRPPASARPPVPPKSQPARPPERETSIGLPALSIGSARRDEKLAANAASDVVRLGRLTRDELRKAILLSEIIQPPVSMRQNQFGGRSS
ncbi:MAG: hypothetical protein AAGE65_14565 [Planctomycetota bacterium]